MHFCHECTWLNYSDQTLCWHHYSHKLRFAGATGSSFYTAVRDHFTTEKPQISVQHKHEKGGSLCLCERGEGEGEAWLRGRKPACDAEKLNHTGRFNWGAWAGLLAQIAPSLIKSCLCTYTQRQHLHACLSRHHITPGEFHPDRFTVGTVISAEASEMLPN